MASMVNPFRKKITTRNPSEPHFGNVFTNDEIGDLFSDLNAHQVDLEMQNERLRLIQTELRRERDRYNRLYDFAPVGYFTVTKKGIVTNSNLKFAEMVDCDRDTLLSMTSLQLIVRDDHSAFFRHLNGIINSREPRSCELHIRRKDGETFPALIHSSPLCDRAGDVTDLCMAVIDMSDLRYVPEDREKQQKLESLGILVGGIAHDFNNLLGGMFGYIELVMACMQGNTEAQEYLKKAVDCVEQSKHLILQLSTFSKGGTPVKKISLIRSIMDNAVRISLCGSNVKCRTTYPPDLYLCDVDPGQINQVLTNLLINSRQAMSDGGTISITAANETVTASRRIFDLPKGKYVKIVVADNGAGIPREVLKKVFDPYFTTKQTGTGLGLAIARMILRKHGGTITISSMEGAGTDVTLYLPAAESGALPAAMNGMAEVRGTGTILIMDDETIILDVATGMLGSLGYSVSTTSGSDETVKAYQDSLKNNKPFDMVILDLTIPGGEGGLQTIKRLREINPDVKAIVASGYSENAVLANPPAYGFIAKIVKPFSKQELGKTVKEALSTKETAVPSAL